MKAFGQFGFLKVNFGKPASDPEDTRVVALFRKRAELKKAYGGLQDEIYRLKDRIKQQEGATQRVQEMLATLEGRLASPETGFPALVFYQLRHLWQSGRELIEQFVADLSRQQEERERKLHFAEHNRRQFARRQTVEAQLREAETRAMEARTRLAALQSERAGLTRFWHYFKRRALDRGIAASRVDLTAVDTVLTQARGAAEEEARVEPPQFPGLSIEARRAINIAAVAYAEVLCLRLVRTSLVKLARDATAHREVHDDYGSPAECQALMVEIAQGLAKLQARGDIAQQVKARTERLKQMARYRTAQDTSPTAESIGFSEGDVLAGERLGASAARMPNVLGEDTWDLFRVLLR